ncbi:hypothetical protein AB0K12_17870 [Nonomuraea sp. NPDC049419]|uniref:hypothetical protein n=1 Tax=unclassified Nonomuraea TaxID=2593643 RepID=UPI003428D592
MSRSGDAAGAALREIAGAGLYRRNAFRITGLSTYADRRAIRQRRQRVNTALQVGADADLDHGMPVGPDEVRAAFDRLLDDPRRRLVDELLWFWDTPDATCSCAKALHQDHDAAVRAHSAALDREIEGTMTGDDERRTLWEKAAREWKGVLRRASFWDHVRSRIDALDDRQLDESAVDALRDALATALLRPLAELAGQRGTTATQSRLAGLARRWPAPRQVIDDQLEEVAAPMYESVRAALSESTGLLEEGEPKRAASNVYDKVLPDLNRLSVLVPPERHRPTAKLRNDTAILFNNCAMALIDSAGLAAAEQARKWFGAAGRLSPDSHTSEAIRGNKASLDELILIFTTIEQEASALLAGGGHRQANAYLAHLERQLGDLASRSELDRIRAKLGLNRSRYRTAPTRTVPARPAPAYHPGGYGVRRRRRGLRLLFWLAVLAALGFLLTQYDALGNSTVALFAPKQADNAPVGECLAEPVDWIQHDIAQVPTISCDEPHWGEVLGYVSLGDAPSTYPGRDQVSALAEFECKVLQLRQKLPLDEYETGTVVPREEHWNTGDGEYENYAPCLVSRKDGESIPSGRRVADPPPGADNVAVRMDVLSPALYDNPPADSCIQSQSQWDKSPHSVDIVKCDYPHWAQIAAYVKLYGAADKTPADDKVEEKAEEMCGSATSHLQIGVGTPFRMTVRVRKERAIQESLIYAVCLVHREDDRLFSGMPR